MSRTPSVKVDSRFYCFGCGASGDVIDFAALLRMDWGNGKLRSGLPEDFGVSYEKSGNAPPDRKRHNRSQPRTKISGAEISGNGTVLFPGAMRLSAPAGALENSTRPTAAGCHLASSFVEALQRISYTEYLLDILLYGEIEEKAALIAAQGKEVLRLEQRISELAAGNAGSGRKGRWTQWNRRRHRQKSGKH